MTDDDPCVTAAGIPMLAGYRGPVERLGGLTNRVYRLGGIACAFPARAPRNTSTAPTRRSRRARRRRPASAPKCSISTRDRRDGDALHRRRRDHVAGDIQVRAGAPARAGQAFRKLHDSGAVFPFRFELFSMIDEYLRVLSTKDVALPDGYHDVVREADGPCAPRSTRIPCRSPPAIAIRCARIFSTPASACGSSTGNIPA